MKEATDLIGCTFGSWTVLSRAQDKIYKDNRHHRRWICQCSCGTVKEVDECAMKNGTSTSCGCTRKEALRKGASEKNRTHGMTNTRLYRIYRHMVNRCGNKNDIRYAHYGARGIKVCQEWDTFDKFAEWSFANGYEDSLSIDRIDVNGDYAPDNCRWATVSEQANNKTTTQLFTFAGKTQSIAQWADEYDIHYKKLWKRLHSGWSIERALLT